MSISRVLKVNLIDICVTCIFEGNFPLFIITSQGHHELRVDLEDWEGNTRFAKYRIFNIGHPAELYNLTTLGYTGDAGKLHHVK